MRVINGHVITIWGFAGAYHLGWSYDCKTCRVVGQRWPKSEQAEQDLNEHCKEPSIWEYRPFGEPRLKSLDT